MNIEPQYRQVVPFDKRHLFPLVIAGSRLALRMRRAIQRAFGHDDPDVYWS